MTPHPSSFKQPYEATEKKGEKIMNLEEGLLGIGKGSVGVRGVKG